MTRMSRILWNCTRSAVIFLLTLMAFAPVNTAIAATSPSRTLCDDGSPLCTETFKETNYEGQYIGHDEPSLLFYDNRAGSGNSNIYRLRLPKDPPVAPTQDGKGGTFNFQLHPAFWFGIAMCDTESAPEFTKTCAPDSDTNIFDNPDPNAPDFIGHHPGAAFMEMQFYPPGWVPWPAGDSCDATKWCAALNIDSLGFDMNNNVDNNAACLNSVGEESVNFAFITKNGVPHAPPSPVSSTLATFTPDSKKDLFMNSGDQLVVIMNDTPHGLLIVIQDLTTGQNGFMTASAANGFGQVKFDPNGTSCQNIPYDFHPMYSTSSEHTRVPWAAHSYNVAFSDEIGHFEYCNLADANGNCATAGVSDPSGVDVDDAFCFNPADSTKVQVGGCFGTDIDFDGVPYQPVWPGSTRNPGQDQKFHPQAIQFSSPLFGQLGKDGHLTGLKNYSRVAFETDLPRIELSTSPVCNRATGADCVNPPVGANFYPFFSTRNQEIGGCIWQEGGAFIPGTTNTFGGSSAAEFGPLLQLAYPVPGGSVLRYNDFRNVLNNNPCQLSPF
jgi:hypothetical protein